MTSLRRYLVCAVLFGAAASAVAGAILLWYAASDDLPRSESTALLEQFMAFNRSGFAVFLAKYLTGLQHAFDAGQLTFVGGTADLAERGAVTRFLGQLRTVTWIVYAKRPFAGPEQVRNYLGRYTHRVALSNDRLVGSS